MYLTGITPTPEVLAVRKTSLGAEQSVSWSHHPNALELLPRLKADGRKIWPLERQLGSIILDLRDLAWAKPASAVLVVGNELTGVDPGILAAADRVLALPMFGRKTSFNAATAFAIAAYALSM